MPSRFGKISPDQMDVATNHAAARVPESFVACVVINTAAGDGGTNDAPNSMPWPQSADQSLKQQAPTSQHGVAVGCFVGTTVSNVSGMHVGSNQPASARPTQAQGTCQDTPQGDEGTDMPNAVPPVSAAGSITNEGVSPGRPMRQPPDRPHAQQHPSGGTLLYSGGYYEECDEDEDEDEEADDGKDDTYYPTSDDSSEGSIESVGYGAHPSTSTSTASEADKDLSIDVSLPGSMHHPRSKHLDCDHPLDSHAPKAQQQQRQLTLVQHQQPLLAQAAPPISPKLAGITYAGHPPPPLPRTSATLALAMLEGASGCQAWGFGHSVLGTALHAHDGEGAAGGSSGASAGTDEVGGGGWACTLFRTILAQSAQSADEAQASSQWQVCSLTGARVV